MEQLNDVSHLATQVQRLTKCSGILAHLYARYNCPVLQHESNMLYVKIPTPQGEVTIVESQSNEHWLCFGEYNIKAQYTADQLVDFIEQLGGKAYTTTVTQKMEQRFKEKLNETGATGMVNRYSKTMRARA